METKSQRSRLVLLPNDNSNPQQGTGSMKSCSMSSGEQRKDSRSLSSSTSTLKSSPSRKDARKLFVGGLPADVMDTEFREFFEKFGVVVDSVVMYDRETHRSRGFGFVTFRDPEVATTLLNMGHEGKSGSNNDGGKRERVGRLVMRGKPCEVKAAEPKESRGPRRPFPPGGGGGGMNRFGGGGGGDRRNYPMNNMYMPPDQSNGAQMFSMGNPYHHPHATAYNPEMVGVMPGGYPMVPIVPSYYPLMMGMGGSQGYAAPMYSPMQAVPPGVQGNDASGHNGVLPMAPLMGAHMEGTGGPSDGPLPTPVVPGYYNPSMSATPPQLHPSQPPQHAQHNQFPINMNPVNQGNYSGSGGMSAMHPAAPGLPGKDSKPASEDSTQQH